jgi:hypothetical protein
VTFAKSEDHTQEFIINVNFHVDNQKKRLLANINVTECRASDMLSQDWRKLSDLGCGYFLESVKISVSPITNVTNNKSQLYTQEDLFPAVKNRCVASSTSIEKQGLEIGQAPKVGFQLTKSNNTIVTSDEWYLKTWGSSTTGDNWMYEKLSNDKFLSFIPGLHISKWNIISEKIVSK